MKRMLTLLPCAGLAALLSGLAGANPGALEINQDCAAVGCFSGDSPGFPVTITHPGSYILTSDLATSDVNKDAIGVSASPVDIDLNGHSIDGGGACSGTPVTSCSGAAGLSGIDASIDINTPLVLHVHNGSVHGFASHGILLVGSGEGSVIEHVSAYENADNGISISGTSANATTTRIHDSQLSRNKFSGVQAVIDPATLVVENSTLTGNGGWGMYVNSQSVATGNRINNNAGVGLFCTALTCVLGQNVFIGNNSAGAQFSIGTLSDMGGNVCADHAGSTCP